MMRYTKLTLAVLAGITLSSCTYHKTNPQDPFESFNRKAHRFNMALDKAILKPAAIAYVSLVPGRARVGVNNFYTNLDMIPTVANDLLQAQFKWAIKDTWRFIINSSLGIGGLLDVAKKFSLPPHSNDLGLTLAKWGDVNSPYLVLPFLGPSTLRDASGWLFQFALYSPYVYLENDTLMYSLIGLRYVDLRSQYLESERLMDEALDKYTFLRDAYLQHRNYQISGVEQNPTSQPADAAPAQAIGNDYVDE